MKCNLDCDYCERGLYGGHDNTSTHPELDQCLRSVDFMLTYADQAMQRRRQSLKHVVMNVYGGESLNHPRIIDILRAVNKKSQRYKNSWTLCVTTTTNLIITRQKLHSLLPLIDEFTVSWHSANKPQHKEQFRQNCLAIKQAGKRIKCIVLMHPKKDLFKDAEKQIEWCKTNDIKYLAKQLDRADHWSQFDYSAPQVTWFDRHHKQTSNGQIISLQPSEHTNLSQQGRSCCGGRLLCSDQNFKQRTSFVPNRFSGWSCSVDHFFLYVKQVTGEVFVNKDCKMNYQGRPGPIGHLDNPQEILDHQLRAPTIICAKSVCHCGLCAPKARDAATYKLIMEKYLDSCDT